MAAGPWPLRPVTVSAGAATLGPDAAAAERLVEAADGALYRAKRDGRDRVVSAGEAASGHDPGERRARGG